MLRFGKVEVMKGWIVLVALLTVGCGSSSTAPSAPPVPSPANIAGNWSGTLQYSKASGQQIEAVLMTLTQAGTAINGTWATSLRNGTVSGTTTPTSFSGTLSYNSTASTGQACTGSLAVSGSAGDATFQWTSPLVTENCTDPPTVLVFALQRR